MQITTRLVIDIETGAVLIRESFEYSGPIAYCIKAATKQAQNAGTTAAATGAGYGRDASTIGSTLVPTLTQEATHPVGINPTDLNAMRVAGAQGAGGANAGVAGEAGLAGARTRNTGALSGVLDQAARERTKAESNTNLGVQNINTGAKLKEKQEGITGLEGLYGTDVNAGLKAQGLVPEDIDAWSRANSTGWLQGLEGIMGSLSGTANSAANLKKAFG